jgi:hypothetical protein
MVRTHALMCIFQAERAARPSVSMMVPIRQGEFEAFRTLRRNSMIHKSKR